MTVKPGKTIALRSLDKLISDGGWTPGKLTIKAQGTLEDVDGKSLFRIAGTNEKFEVVKKHKHTSDAPGTFTVIGVVRFEGSRMTLEIDEVVSER